MEVTGQALEIWLVKKEGFVVTRVQEVLVAASQDYTLVSQPMLVKLIKLVPTLPFVAG